MQTVRRVTLWQAWYASESQSCCAPAGPTIADVATSDSGGHFKPDVATWTPKDVQQPKKEL